MFNLMKTAATYLIIGQVSRYLLISLVKMLNNTHNYVPIVSIVCRYLNKNA